MNHSLKRILQYVLPVLGFVVLALAYFNPVLQGRQIFQSDIAQYRGMSKQQTDFRNQTGTETYWTNSAFGGMPTYQLGAQYPHNYIKKLDATLRFLPRPADYLFLYFLSFFILLLVLKVDYKLAALGALAFGFSTYLIIILGVGHNSKAHAIAYMPLVLAGIVLTFKKRYVAGFLLTTLAMGLELFANHYQMTYYLLLLVVVLGLSYLVYAIKRNILPDFLKALGILVVAVLLSIGLNATNILATKEYVAESTRGKSELTMTPNGTPKQTTDGLDKDYITEYSYGKLESFDLFIPRFMGGGNHEPLGQDSNTYEAFRRLGASPVEALQQADHAPMYWGNQPIVEAPAYIGAIVIFLAVVALFLVKGRLRWWLVGGTLLSLFLSFGKNFSLLTDFFIDYVPLYNKFRAVSSIQVLLELCVPILAVFGLVKIFHNKDNENSKLKAIKWSTVILGGLALVFLLLKTSLFDFKGLNDDYYAQAYGRQFIEALKQDRIHIFTIDTLRSLVLVLLSAGLLWMYLKKKLNQNKTILAFAVLILFDLVMVDRRYVNNDDFVSKRQVETPFQPTQADLQVLKDTTHYKVLDLTANPFNSARASYFHNAFGGYHAAKPRRAQEIMNYQIQKNNLQVLNMLNIKYIIKTDEQGQTIPLENPKANGNAWFIEALQQVDTADKAMQALDSLNTKDAATIQKSQVEVFDSPLQTAPKRTITTFKYTVDSTATIQLKEFKPNYLKYQSNNPNDGFAVFSENYYKNGWQATIDGEPVAHYRVDYLLRGLPIPAGNHIVEFKFDPQVVKTGSTIALASSILVGLLLLGGLFYEFRKRQSA